MRSKDWTLHIVHPQSNSDSSDSESVIMVAVFKFES